METLLILFVKIAGDFSLSTRNAYELFRQIVLLFILFQNLMSWEDAFSKYIFSHSSCYCPGVSSDHRISFYPENWKWKGYNKGATSWWRRRESKSLIVLIYQFIWWNFSLLLFSYFMGALGVAMESLFSTFYSFRTLLNGSSNFK